MNLKYDDFIFVRSKLKFIFAEKITNYYEF